MTTTSSTGLGKPLAFALGALLVGLAVGTASMKADLRHARGEIDSLKAQLAKRGGGSSGLSGITSMLQLPDAKASRSSKPSPRPHQHRSQAIAQDPTPVSSNAVVAATATNLSPVNHLEEIEKAAELWKTRVDLARNSFVGNVALTDEQAMHFDVAMAAMNLRLSNSVRTWVEVLKKTKEITPETGIKMLNDFSGDLVWAYKDLDRKMPEGWRAQAGDKFQVVDFINPEVAMPLMEVSDRFSAPSPESAGSQDGVRMETGISF